MPNTRKIIIKNISINFILTLIMSIGSFVFNRFFIHILGAEFNGLIRLFTQLTVYLSLADMGVTAAASYSLYKPLEEKDDEKLNIAFYTLKCTYHKIALAIFILGCLLTPFLPFLIKDFDFKAIYYGYWLIYVFNTAFAYIGLRYTLLLNADHKFYITRTIHGLVIIFCIALRAFFIKAFANFNLILLVNIFEMLANIFFTRLYFKRHYSFEKKTKQKDSIISKNIFYLMCHHLGSLVVYNTDYIVISKFLSLTQVTLYSSYVILSNVISRFFDIITNVVIPVIGRFNAKDNTEDSYKLFKIFFAVFFYIGTLCSLIFFRSANAFITLWLGQDFTLPIFTVFLLIINFFINIIRKPVDIFSSTSGYFSDILIPLLEAVINLLVSIVLVRKVGLNGVIIGTIASNLLIVFFLKPLRFYKIVFKLHPLKYFVDVSKYFLYLAIIISIEYYLSKIIQFSTHSLFFWGINLLTYAGLVFIVQTAIFLVDKQFREFIVLILKKRTAYEEN
ncbi:MAG: lipopolysaccharide biosynthesis protein [Treponemataceae bacterium]